jgi:hypothetical protein
MIEDIYTELDFLLAPVYFALIFLFAKNVQSRRIKENPLYAYYARGMLFKLVASIGVCIIFLYYYKAGDNIGYFWSAEFCAKMLTLNPKVFFSVLLNERTHENLSVFFNSGLCCPDYWKDSQSFTIVRICSLLIWPSLNNFVVASMLFAWISYGGIFRLFLLFNKLFPGMEKKFAIAILYMPSVIFWGSAILKDTVTFSCACWLTWSVYNIFIVPNKLRTNILIAITVSFLLISIKPYIFVAFLPGLTLWIVYFRIMKIKTAFIRILVGPAIIISGVGLATFLFSSFNESLGEYGSVDKAINKAVVTKNDLTREAYGKNSFDIGELDGSVGGMLGKFPAAVTAGLFRPFLWDATNPVMLFSALENSFLFFMFIRVLLKNGPLFFTRIFGNPVLTLCFVFSIFFAFALGLTTANFGALVRYKIPAIPFFLSMLYVLDLSPQQLEALKEKSIQQDNNEVVEA